MAEDPASVFDIDGEAFNTSDPLLNTPHLELVPALTEDDNQLGDIDKPVTLGELTQRQLDALELRFDEHGNVRPFSEVASVLGISSRAAGFLVQRAFDAIGDTDPVSAIAIARQRIQEDKEKFVRPEPMPEGPYREYLALARISAQRIPYLSHADKEDVVQNVLAKLILQGGVPHPDTPGSTFNPAAYIEISVRNEAKYRYKRNTLTAVSSLDDAENNKNKEAASDSQIFGLPPEAVSARTERDKFVMDAISQLTERHRDLLILNAQGYDYREVAEMLKLPIGTVTSGLARARRKIMEILEISMHHPDFNPAVYYRLINAGQQG